MFKKRLRIAFIIYVITWIAIFLLIVILAMVRGQEFGEAVSTFLQAAFYPSFLIFMHIIFGIVYVLFLLFSYFRRTRKNHGTKFMLKRLGLRLLLPALLIYGSARAVISYNLSEAYDYIWDTSVENKTGLSNNYYARDGKHRGMSVRR